MPGSKTPLSRLSGFDYERPTARHLAIGVVTGNPGIHEINERANAPAEKIIDAVAAAMAAGLRRQPPESLRPRHLRDGAEGVASVDGGMTRERAESRPSIGVPI